MTDGQVFTFGLCLGGILLTLFYLWFLWFTLWEKGCCGKTPHECRCCPGCKAVDRSQCLCRKHNPGIRG